MFSYLVSVAYDGSDFSGWAKQPHEFNVQGYIEDSLSKALKKKIKILGTSRTDKGVHARDQHFLFNLPFFIKPYNLKLVTNKILKKYILVNQVKVVKKNNFHPIRDVIEKEYRYLINTGKYNIYKRKYQWEYNSQINVKELNSILEIFKGTHDFFNFCFLKEKNREKRSTLRTINYLKAHKKKDLLTIKIKSRGFLRYQIRAILGESINCYEKKQTFQNLQRKLDDLYQSNKYRVLAPANGLYLWKIRF